MKTKKATQALGIGIMAFALLLLLGGIISDTDFSYNEKNEYLENKDHRYGHELPEENYLFYINESDIGRQNIVRESYPNIELGSKEEFKTVYIANNIELKANPFTKTKVNLRITPSNRENLQKLLIYANPESISGKQDLLVYINGNLEAQISPKSNHFPITLTNIPQNSSFTLTLELVKPKWYQLFNWNKLHLKDFRVVEVNQNEENNKREFNFHIEKDFLETVTIDLSISCENIKELSEAIEVKVNDYIISNQNPQCTSKHNRISAEVPLNILSNKINTLELKTSGFYKVAYSINKVYFNDQQEYKFTINSFNDIIDVIMYGDFDREVIDIKLNTKILQLERDEIKYSEEWILRWMTVN